MQFVPCKYSDIPSYSTTWYDATKDNAWYGGIVYSKKRTDCASNLNLRYSFQCGPNAKWLTLVNSCSVQGTGTTCTLTNGALYGVGAKYTGTTTTISVGSTVTLNCNDGYGRQIITGTSATVADSSETCLRTTTDRTGNAPKGTCDSTGTINVSNDCSACRDCNSASSGYTDKINNYCYQNCSGSTDQCFVIQSSSRGSCGNSGDSVTQITINSCSHYAAGVFCGGLFTGGSCGKAYFYYSCKDGTYDYSWGSNPTCSS